MLNISGLKEGIVLDHIEAGKSLDIYYHLGLDKLECQVAIIKNARSNKMGRKDIKMCIRDRESPERTSMVVRLPQEAICSMVSSFKPIPRDTMTTMDAVPMMTPRTVSAVLSLSLIHI